jgi:hypothetical protein
LDPDRGLSPFADAVSGTRRLSGLRYKRRDGWGSKEATRTGLRTAFRAVSAAWESYEPTVEEFRLTPSVHFYAACSACGMWDWSAGRERRACER